MLALLLASTGAHSAKEPWQVYSDDLLWRCSEFLFHHLALSCHNWNQLPQTAGFLHSFKSEVGITFENHERIIRSSSRQYQLRAFSFKMPDKNKSSMDSPHQYTQRAEEFSPGNEMEGILTPHAAASNGRAIVEIRHEYINTENIALTFDPSPPGKGALQSQVLSTRHPSSGGYQHAISSSLSS